jgi:hypothetical protein
MLSSGLPFLALRSSRPRQRRCQRQPTPSQQQQQQQQQQQLLLQQHYRRAWTAAISTAVVARATRCPSDARRSRRGLGQPTFSAAHEVPAAPPAERWAWGHQPATAVCQRRPCHAHAACGWATAWVARPHPVGTGQQQRPSRPANPPPPAYGRLRPPRTLGLVYLRILRRCSPYPQGVIIKSVPNSTRSATGSAIPFGD